MVVLWLRVSWLGWFLVNFEVNVLVCKRLDVHLILLRISVSLGKVLVVVALLAGPRGVAFLVVMIAKVKVVRNCITLTDVRN